VLVVTQFRRMLADADKRFSWDGRVLAMKWVGDLVGKIETARLTRTLGTLLATACRCCRHFPSPRMS
jgi:general secretion pathway protein F